MAVGATLLGAPPAVAKEPLEITSLRLIKSPSICIAPQDVAEELLRAEGFTDIRYVPGPVERFQEKLASGELDLGLEYASKYVVAIDRGLPVTMLSGAHVGCFELFGNESVRSITDLKGKRVGDPSLRIAAPFIPDPDSR
jgi:NitT/TauT family transport system substrate-binding protein